MVSVLSLLIPIALSAVFVFIASSIIHMATPWHKNDLRRIPNEDGVMNALRSFNIPPGEYGFPKPDSMKDMGTPEFQAKYRAGPVAFLTVRPSGDMGMSRNLVMWFIYSLVVSVFAGYIAGVAFGPGTEYLRIMHESIWWGRSWSRTIRSMLDGLLYGLLTGGTFGWLWPK